METAMSEEEIGRLAGTKIAGEYSLEKRVGESSLGEIYDATRETEEGVDSVRVEILSGTMDDENVGRFLQEVELLTSINHPNILRVLAAGEDSGYYYLVTQSEAGGCSLDDYMLQHSPLAEREVMKLMIPIVDALHYVWETKKLLHRDFKPTNVFITSDHQARLTGFGIAKSSEEGQSMDLTGIGFTIGTPEYMSPEQIRGTDDLDFRCDMYSLGISMYEMVTGSLPFEEIAPLLLMQKQMDEPPEPANERNVNVSGECAELLNRILEKDREDRYESWQALTDAMKSVAARGGSGTAKTTDSEGKTRRKGCTLKLAVIAVIIITTVAIVASLL
jgi:serine/threonine protein kinase